MKASLELQKALTTVLGVLNYDVYDFQPRKVSYPFIFIGDDRQSTLDTKNADYVGINSTILVFSDYKGNKEVKTILEDIKQNCMDMALDTYKILGAKVTSSFVVFDEQNKVNQGVIEINYKLIN